MIMLITNFVYLKDCAALQLYIVKQVLNTKNISLVALPFYSLSMSLFGKLKFKND